MKDAAAAIAEMTQDNIKTLEQNGSFDVLLKGNPVSISLEDVEITSEDIPGWQVNSQGGLTVALDTKITPELREEGIAREVINRVQNLRKDKGFEVTDKITVKLKRHDIVNQAIENNLVYICAEILANSFELVEDIQASGPDEIEVEEGVKTLIKIERLSHGN
jgi:isoleucyl-tRNA synthetase